MFNESGGSFDFTKKNGFHHQKKRKKRSEKMGPGRAMKQSESLAISAFL